MGKDVRRKHCSPPGVGAPAVPASPSQVTCAQHLLFLGHRRVSDTGQGSVRYTVCKPCVSHRLAPEVTGTLSLGCKVSCWNGDRAAPSTSSWGQWFGGASVPFTDFWVLHFQGHSSGTKSLIRLLGPTSWLPREGTPVLFRARHTCASLSGPLLLPCHCPIAALSATPGCGPLEPRHCVCSPRPQPSIDSRDQRGFPQGSGI